MPALSLTDISAAFKNASICVRVPELKRGHVCVSKGIIECYSGNYGAVFKYSINGTIRALRVWTKDISILPELPRRAQEVSLSLSTIQSPYLAHFCYHPDGILVAGSVYPLVEMEWCMGQNLKDFINANLGNKSKLNSIRIEFLNAIKFFHSIGLSHGDLQHGNIIISSTNSIKFIDYDSIYLPSYGNKCIEIIKGLPDYQHPGRVRNQYMNSKVDYFSELIIYLTIAAVIESPKLWEKYNVASRDYSLLFDANDFDNFENSPIYKDLMNLGSSIKELTSVLSLYLNEKDISKLSPFYFLVSHMNPDNSRYCIRCGHKFQTEDEYCTICGRKRYL